MASLGLEVREGRARAGVQAGAALMSCVATLLQLLVVAGATQPAWLSRLWLPALSGAAVAALWGGWLMRTVDAAPAGAPAPGAKPDEARMFSLRGAAVVAVLLTGIQAGVHGLGLWLGDGGLLAGTLLAALFEVHSAMAALFVQGLPSGPHGAALLRAVMLGLSVHALAKCMTAALSGGARYALAFAAGQLTHTAVAVGLLAWLSGGF